MTAPTGLGQYVPPAASQGDRIQAQQMVDKPILVWVRKHGRLNRTKFSADGGEAVYLDFIDLQTNQCYIEVMWMAGAIVDGLKQYAGDGNAYPVKVVRVQGGQHGFYQRIESLNDDPTWMNHVLTNLATFQNLIAQARAQKEAEWATAMQQANQPPQVPGAPPVPTLTPAQVAAPNSQAGLYDQAMAMQPPHVQQALQQHQQQAQPPAAPPAAAPQQPQYQQPAAAAPQQFQQAPQQQVPAGPPPQYQQVAGQVQQPPAAPPAQPGYQPQQYAAPGQPAAPPQAAVAPPQYGAPAAPAAPPGPPAGVQQQYPQAGPPAPPVQQMAPPGLPPAPGAVTGQSVAELQAQLAQIQ